MTPEPDPRLPPPAVFRRSPSITTRLVFLYAGSTTFLLTMAAGYLYWGLQQSLLRADRALVSGKLQVLRVLLSEKHDKPELLVNEIEHEASANELLKYYLRVLDDRGTVLLETSGMSSILPTLAFAPLSEASDASPRIAKRRLPSGRTYLMLTGVVTTGAAIPKRRIVQIALDVAHNDAVLIDYRRALSWTLIAGIGLAAGVGVLVARLGLRPLRAMATATRRITINRLDARMSAPTWPSELRELASSFDAMLDHLQDAFGRLTECSADIAHALRNPVNNLRGETEVALTRARSPDEYRQILGSSLEEYERLSAMIEALLFMARADDPRTALMRSRFQIREQMEAVREFYDAVAGEQQVMVTCEGDAAMEGDPMLVRRAISNLLGNALKHTTANGKVTLSARALATGGAEVIVSDNGCGIPAEHLPKVFERFYQVDQSRSFPAKGAGLGLAIVRSIMRLHGGEASIASAPGHGTSVILKFPAVPVRKL